MTEAAFFTDAQAVFSTACADIITAFTQCTERFCRNEEGLIDLSLLDNNEEMRTKFSVSLWSLLADKAAKLLKIDPSPNLEACCVFVLYGLSFNDVFDISKNVLSKGPSMMAATEEIVLDAFLAHDRFHTFKNLLDNREPHLMQMYNQLRR